MKIEQMIEAFLLTKRAEQTADATVRWYASILRSFARWLATEHARELKPVTMRRYLVHLNERHKAPGATRGQLSPHSIQSIHRGLKVFFGWCAGDPDIPMDASPMAGVKVKRPEPAEPRRALHGEVTALIRSIPVDGWIGLRDYLIVHTIYFCGLRVGELVRLEERHFDIVNGVLHVPGGKTGAGLVPLVRDVSEAFLAYQIHRPRVATDKLFVASYGTGDPRPEPLTTTGVRVMIQRRCEEAGIRRLNPHSFRHGLAMHLLNSKRVDATLVQRILRHANLRTTTTFYAKWNIDALADEYRSVMEED
jgi:integrase/recombinase XerD